MGIREINERLDEAVEELNESLWSGKVKTKWKPPEGFFTQSAGKIATGLKKASKSYGQAMSRLNFYVNRAGGNLSSKEMTRLADAKNKLKKMYG